MATTSETSGDSAQPPTPREQRGTTLPALVSIMERLLADDGCPWDREQTLQTLRPFLIEEAHEVLEAIDANDAAGHCEELGDLLFQIVFHAALRAREGAFGIDDVVASIANKMTFRHPHVFGDAKVKDAADVLVQWDVLKAQEKGKAPKKSALDGVPVGLPALLRAQRIGEKAAKVGFDWPDARGVMDKVQEELREIEEAVKSGDEEHVARECGDLLLAASRLAAKLGVAPEDALREATTRFSRRFGAVEDELARRGRTPKESNLDEMDRIWNEVKQKLDASAHKK
jgi:MazG family protein